MKDFVLVEFMCIVQDAATLRNKIDALTDRFQFERYDISDERDEDDTYRQYIHIWGKLESETAAFIRLQDAFLAERMRISYIPDDLKDKYRTKK